MNLIGGDQLLLADAERRGHARAVLRDLGRQVVRAHAAIETRIESIGHAAVAGEEGMTDASKSTERCGLEHVGLIYSKAIAGLEPRQRPELRIREADRL